MLADIMYTQYAQQLQQCYPLHLLGRQHPALALLRKRHSGLTAAGQALLRLQLHRLQLLGDLERKTFNTPLQPIKAI